MVKQWRIKDIQIVDDSQVLISWEKGLENLQSLLVAPSMQNVRALISDFSDISFRHIYREYNCTLDRLLKKGIGEMDGYIHFEVWRNKSFTR